MENKQVHIPYGLITGLLIILINVVLHYTMPTSKAGGYIAMIPLPIGLIMCCIAYSRKNDGYVTFGQTFASGFKAAAIITLLVAGFTLLATYIWPEMKEQLMAEARKGVAAKDADSAAMEQGFDWMDKNFRVMVVGGTLFNFMLFGALFSLIGAAVAKKNGPRIGGEHLDQPAQKF